MLEILELSCCWAGFAASQPHSELRAALVRPLKAVGCELIEGSTGPERRLQHFGIAFDSLGPILTTLCMHSEPGGYFLGEFVHQQLKSTVINQL